nr:MULTISPECIES: ABC-type transport auxiliary lipoprotein family protein [unclassified Myxococcus]
MRPAGGSVTFSVRAFDMYGNEAPAFLAMWTVVNGGGTVDASDVFCVASPASGGTKAVAVAAARGVGRPCSGSSSW